MSLSAVKVLVRTAHAKAAFHTRQMENAAATTTTYLAPPNLACVVLRQVSAATKRSFAPRVARADHVSGLPQL